MLHAALGSPIGALVTFSAGHAALTGLLIAFGELAAGLGALAGLFTRAAAAVGMLLALSFFPTVSWRTTPVLLRIRHRVPVRVDPAAARRGRRRVRRTHCGAQAGP